MKKFIVLLALPLAFVACKKDSSDASKTISNVAKKVSTKKEKPKEITEENAVANTPNEITQEKPVVKKQAPLQNKKSIVILEKNIAVPVALENIQGLWKITHVHTRWGKVKFSKVAGDLKDYEMYLLIQDSKLQQRFKLISDDNFIQRPALDLQLVGNSIMTKDTAYVVNADYKIISLKKRSMRIQDLSRKSRMDYYLTRVN